MAVGTWLHSEQRTEMPRRFALATKVRGRNGPDLGGVARLWKENFAANPLRSDLFGVKDNSN